MLPKLCRVPFSRLASIRSYSRSRREFVAQFPARRNNSRWRRRPRAERWSEQAGKVNTAAAGSVGGGGEGGGKGWGSRKRAGLCGGAFGGAPVRSGCRILITSVIDVKGPTGRDEAFLNPTAPARPYLLSKHLLRPARDYARGRDCGPLYASWHRAWLSPRIRHALAGVSFTRLTLNADVCRDWPPDLPAFRRISSAGGFGEAFNIAARFGSHQIAWHLCRVLGKVTD